jgi:hypothetical protein
MRPKYPVYIISKGRWEKRATAKALERMHVPYKIVIEPQEYDNYAAVISPKRILTLPFSNLGQGSIPARNWVWEHSLKDGHERHWILDDNIFSIQRLNNGTRIDVDTGAIFCAAEEFVNRYTNIALSGFNYRTFVIPNEIVPAYYLNTRIYSCILIRNEIKHRWRGKYNEDTDLSLRILKDGWCTILFNTFIINKAATMTMKGGNTEELYSGDGRLEMAKSLKEQHPDVTRITWRWGRWQHQVDYRRFRRNKLEFKPGIILQNKINNFGMVLKNV